jgi:two-component system, NarL family, response regulator NreC
LTVRVLIADDHNVVRAGLHALLANQPGLEVIGEAERGGQALQLAQEMAPDLLLMDISMPEQDGIQVARQLAQAHSPIRILFLTVHEDEELLREALRVGASGYVVKRAVESELLDAIAAVMRGELYIHPSMTRALLTDTRPSETLSRRQPEDLTPREMEVLRLIVDGYTNAQIADLLVLSVRTVDTHRANIMGKLGLRRRAELVQYALNRGILNSPH